MSVGDLVLAADGSRLGIVGRVTGDRFLLDRARGVADWVSDRAVFRVRAGVVTLVCVTSGLPCYVVSAAEGG